MQPPIVLAQAGLWFLSALVIAGAILVVTLGNLFRAALSLGVVLVGVAGLFLLVGAEFLAFVQILIYVGAILTLVVFAIMLTARVHRPAGSTAAASQWPAAVASLALFALLACVIAAIPVPTPTAVGGAPVSLQELGRELITTLVLPFEVISVVFVASMVGAIAVAASPRQRRAQAPPSSSA
ncbi:MAG: NADH-quinone oxidoreductase subunit J [Candidatus Omnitrophica bacterium]|nr:NADH-quinone oxidoreductase subunit J [Candidatus Omnitrophota bacterium]